jgi:hypothetical protein
MSQLRNQHEAVSILGSALQDLFFLGFLFSLKIVTCPAKRRSTFTGLHGIISQKMRVLIPGAVRTLNPTFTRVSFISAMSNGNDCDKCYFYSVSFPVHNFTTFSIVVITRCQASTWKIGLNNLYYSLEPFYYYHA